MVPPADRHRGQRGAASGSSTKYEDVVAVSRDWQTFSSEKSPDAEGGGIMIPDIGPEFGVGTMMLMMDPPKHTRYRKIVIVGVHAARASSSSKPRSSAGAAEIVDA